MASGADTQADGSVQGMSHGHMSHKEDTNPAGRGRAGRGRAGRGRAGPRSLPTGSGESAELCPRI